MADRNREMVRWLEAFVEDRRTNPRDDVCTALIQAETDDGEPALSTAEVIAVINGMLVAGTETSAIFLPLLLRELLRHPDQWRAVQDNRSLIGTAIEEGLRAWTPARAVRRLVCAEMTLGGVTFQPGDEIMLMYISADHDEAVFEHPERYDVRRPNANKHLAFGRYTHMCIGAPLARLEACVALEAVIDRLPNLRLAAPETEAWLPHVVTPKFTTLPLKWDVPA